MVDGKTRATAGAGSPDRRAAVLPFGLIAGGLIAGCGWVVVAWSWLGRGPGLDLLPPLPLLVALCGGVAVGAAAGLAAVLSTRRRLRRASGQSATADELFNDVAHAGAEFIWEADPAGHITMISDGFERSLGGVRADAIGLTWDQMPGLVLADAGRRAMTMAVASQRAFRDVEATLAVGDGQTRNLRLIGRPYFDAAGDIEGYRGAAIDISDVVQARERLSFVDRHDTLTGLLNRVGALRVLAALLRPGRAGDERAVLLVVDIDRFRSINEAFGAAAGDMVIQQAAERIRVCAREGDAVARLGADEFVLLRPRALPFDPLIELTRRLEQTLEERFSVTDESLKLACHIGIYEITPDDRDPETCLRRAQLAASRGKREGKSARLFMDGMDVEAQTVRRLEEDLRLAIAESKLALAYQPQLALRTGRYVGAEALLRWHHREHGFISPARFIPLAERTGLVVELSRWALRRACLDSRRLGEFHIAVNLSPLDLAAPDFVESVQATLQETGVDPGRLEFEITEGVLIEDTETTLDVLLRLKRLGPKIALDDFGTGYAGLGYLQMFPFDKLKIDQSFIRRIGRSRHAAAIVRSVVALAHELGLVVCAEGVETEDQLQLLVAEGCDVVQGFYAGQPMPVSQIQAMIQRQTALGADAAPPHEAAPATAG